MTKSNSSPRLTAIVPNYNHAQYIRMAIAALLSQDLPPDDIIIIDDASTDDSLAVIRSIVESGGGVVRLIRQQKNLGAIAALNLGLSEAKGQYIYFGSADDVTYPTLFRTLIELLETNPTAALACGETKLTDHSGKTIGYRPVVRPANKARHFAARETQRMLASSDHWILTGASVYRRELIAAFGGFNDKFESFADGFVSKQLAIHHGFCFSPTVLAEWKIDDKGYSRVTAGNHGAVQALIERMLDVIATDPTFPAGYASLYRRRARFAICRIATQARPLNLDVLEKLGPSSSMDKLLLSIVSGLQNLTGARVVLLIWLTLRLRPMSITRVVATKVMRSMALIRTA